MGKTKSKVYAVGVGRKTGIFNTWTECEKQVKHYSGAKFKSFPTREEAQTFVSSFQETGNGSATTTTKADSHPATAKKSNCEVNVQDPSRRSPENDKKRKATATARVTDDKRTAVESLKAAGGADASATTNHPPQQQKQQQQLRELVKILIMFDGGSRGNPGRAGAGALVSISTRDRSSSSSSSSSSTAIFSVTRKIRVRHYLGQASTNNEAEYSGVCQGLETSLQEVRGMRRDDPTTRLEVQLTVQGDSQLVIKQLTREYRCKHPKLQVYLNQARRLVEDLSQLCLLRIEFQHVLREYNSVADGLANQAMDAERSWVTVDDSDVDDDGSHLPR